VPGTGSAPSATTTIEALAEDGTDLLDVERHLGDQDHRGAAGDTRMGGDPAGVAPHHLDHHHAVVTLGRGVQSVDRVGGDLHGRREPEGELGAHHVVVDRLRHTDDREPEVAVHLAGDAQRAVAADHDEGVEPHLTECVDHALGTARMVVRAAATCAEQGAAAGQHAAQRRHVERHGATLHHTVPGVEETHQLVAVHGLALADDRSDDGIQAGAIATTCQDPDSHVSRS
jgi:hypothetical protein